MSQLQLIFTQSTVLFVGLVIYFLLKNYWPKYFEAKGTNRAAKEDIGEITKIVESIKTQLLQKTEELKAYISLTNQHRLNIKSAEREAIIDFNKRAFSWYFLMMHCQLSNFNWENYQELLKIKQEIADRQYQYDLALGHLTLFFTDLKFFEVEKEFSSQINSLTKSLTKAMGQVYYLSQKCESKLG